MTPRAILFDLDGTLLDTLADIATAANHALQAGGFATHPIDAYRQFVGDGVEMLLRRALPPTAAADDTIRGDRIAAYRDAYARGWNLQTRPYDGIPELLDTLVDRGLALAVLSNKPDQFTQLCVAEYLGRWPFAAVLGHREGTPHKPDPAGALEIARRLGLEADPSAIVYLGDTSTDMLTARRAGMVPVGVAWGFRPAEELHAHGAAAVIARPNELLGLLDAWPGIVARR